MKFFADENVAGAIIQWLRQAEESARIIVTADKDFGELIFRDRLNSHGIVLVRM